MDDGAGPVGFIGLGIMGSLLVRRLLDAGYEVVVYNRTQAKMRPLVEEGAQAVSSAREIAQRCRRAFLAVSGPNALAELLSGPPGILGADDLALDHICDLSTQDPASLLAAQAALARRGIDLSESPMAGSVADASRGTLQFLHGGDAARLRELAGPFACWGPPPIHFGPLGTAASAKLALNLILGAMAAGLADALQLVRGCDLDERRFMDVLSASGLRSPLYDRLWQRHTGGDYAPRFSLGNLLKDIELCRDHPGWGSAPPATLDALAVRLRVMAPECLASDYSVLLRHVA